MTKRYYHSVSVFRLGAHCVWVLVFGGVPKMAATSIIELPTAILLCVQSAVATAADAHTDSGGAAHNSSSPQTYMYNYYQLSLSHYEEWVGSKDEATHY